jgi:hypothetical protein
VIERKLQNSISKTKYVAPEIEGSSPYSQEPADK